MSDLPNDWETYAGVAFHAFILGSAITSEKGETLPPPEQIVKTAIAAGIELARAIEKKNEEDI